MRLLLPAGRIDTGGVGTHRRTLCTILMALVPPLLVSTLVFVDSGVPAAAAPDARGLFDDAASAMAPTGDTLTFAAFGDYGSSDDVNEQAVADIVHAQEVDLIITTGDNSYGSSVQPPATSTIDYNIGKSYADYIGAYAGAYGTGSPTNRFFPTPGNHDYTDGGGIAAYLAFFTLPGAGITTSGTSGSELYYDFVQGPVHFFAIDSDLGQPGVDLDAQKVWLQQQLSDSTATWNVVYFHHAAFSSSTYHGSSVHMQWPFEAWGADAVLAGHDHAYERILRDDNADGTDLVYLTTGAGGRSLYSFGAAAVPGSQVRYSDNYGTVIAAADSDSLTFEFWSITGGGTLIDAYTINAAEPIDPGPDTTAPAHPVIDVAIASDRKSVIVTWADVSDETSYQVWSARTINGPFAKVGPALPADSTSATVLAVPFDLLCIRVDASNAVGVAASSVVCIDGGDSYGLVDPDTGIWTITDFEGDSKVFYYGNPGDVPFMGDWDCDGIDTPGLYRQSDGYVYLRNSNTQGVADRSFYFGDPGDVPLAGDFNGDGCDTVSLYRPSEARFYVINTLGSGDTGLGSAELSYIFGDPGDTPFAGDFDGDGIDTFGLYRTSSGLMYYRNSHTQGIADYQFYYGNPDDRFVSGDWNANGVSSPAVFRPSNRTVYLKHLNTQGNADREIAWPGASAAAFPVAGAFGDLSRG